MEKILGIIAEYNPFHHGHFMHLKQSKQITKADYTICVMSGNFVQRGEPAILDKWIRASNATHHGIDLVIELPTVYATSSAENFARGAISIFNDLKIDYLSFGSECGDLEILKKIASFLENEPSDFKDQLTHHIKSGDSFVKARAKAICHYFENSKKIDDILKNAWPHALSHNAHYH